MKLKFLIVLPLILTVGILLGHLMGVLANPGAPNPGHLASSVGGDTDSERTFYSSGKYTFPGAVKGATFIANDVANAFYSHGQVCPSGWSCHISTWDIAAQSIQSYGGLNVALSATINGDLTVNGNGGNVCHKIGVNYYNCPSGGYSYDVKIIKWDVPESSGGATYYEDPYLQTTITTNQNSVLMIWASGKISYDTGPNALGYYRITVDGSYCTGSYRSHSNSLVDSGGSNFNTMCILSVTPGTHTIRLQFSDTTENTGRTHLQDRNLFVQAFNT